MAYLNGFLGIFLAAILLSGCASQQIAKHMAVVDQFAQRELGVPIRWHQNPLERQAAEENTRALLDKPLEADEAVRIALSSSASFQRLLHEHAAELAEALQTGRIANPAFEYERLAGGGVVEIERTLAVSLLDIVLWPWQARLSSSELKQAELTGTIEVLRLAIETRRAWITAVAAQQSVKYAEQVQRAAQAGAELGKRMHSAGNFARVEHAQEEVFLADATTELAQASLEAQAAREALVRILGLNTEQAQLLKLPERLPDLPKSALTETTVLQRSTAERLDVRLAQAQLQTTARQLGLTRITSWVDVLEIGAQRVSATDEPRQRGVVGQLSLPLFDFGDARRANAKHTYMAALAHTAEVANSATSQLREYYAAYQTQFELARRYRDEIIPLRKTISDEKLRLYNGMLISVFELLTDSREQVTAVRAALATERDFWLSEAQLRAVLLGVML
jgi:outer membrane protein TolC